MRASVRQPACGFPTLSAEPVTLVAGNTLFPVCLVSVLVFFYGAIGPFPGLFRGMHSFEQVARLESNGAYPRSPCKSNLDVLM